MDKFSLIKAPIKHELDEQVVLLKDSLKSQIPLIDSVVRYFLEQKGKMIRPVLVLLSAKMAGDGHVNQITKNAAVALELLHNASLIHDDVVDESDERRGRASVNHTWDNKVAVLMGDFFLARCLIQSTLTRTLAIQEVLSNLAASLSEGEIQQLSNARGKVLSEEAYYTVIKNKTASLFAACMRLGAISVNATPDKIDALTSFGEKLGIIFQIRDDIFDYFTDPVIGKPTGNDIQEGKITLPLLYALLHCSGKMHDEMLALIEKEELSKEEICSLVDYARINGGIEYAQATMRRLAFETKSLLNIFPDNEIRQSLYALVDYVIERNK